MRKREDSNLRYRYRYAAFRERCLQPLGHASIFLPKNKFHLQPLSAQGGPALGWGHASILFSLLVVQEKQIQSKMYFPHFSI